MLNVSFKINYLLDETMSYPRFTFYLLESLTEELSFPDPLSSVKPVAATLCHFEAQQGGNMKFTFLFL